MKDNFLHHAKVILEILSSEGKIPNDKIGMENKIERRH